MQKKSKPQSTGSASSQTRKKSTTVRKKSVSCCDKKKNTIFLATVIFEAASNICTRLGREVDTGSFPLTYTRMKQLYEEADTWQ